MSMGSERITEGTVLVAQPGLGNPGLHRAVMLVIRNEENAVYTAVNIASPRRMKGTEIHEGGPEDSGMRERLRFIFPSPRNGGMRQLGDTGYVVAELPDRPESAQLYHSFTRAQDRPANAMFITGQAVWSAEQLAMQMKAGFWRVSDAKLDDLMRQPQEARWEMATPGPATVHDISAARGRQKRPGKKGCEPR